MVTNLLHVDHSSVLEFGLECLSQNWIQWLTPVMRWVHIGNIGHHHLFHSLHGVVGVGSSKQVVGNCSWHDCDLLKDGSWSHAPDWEAYRCQVELATQYCSANLSYAAFDCTSQVVHGFNIIEREAAILVSIWTSKVIVKFQRFELLSSFIDFLGISFLICFLIVSCILHVSQNLLYDLLLLMLRQIILKRKIFASLQVFQRINQVYSVRYNREV